jgi:CSLREA domain-containing protein
MHFYARTLVLTALALGCAVPAATQTGFTFVVSSAGDGADASPGNGVCAAASGGCTLRAAIQEANAVSGPDTIRFAVGSGGQTINVGSALPEIVGPVTVDATSQPGFGGTPIVVVNGTGGGGAGLRIAGTGATVRGLAVVAFPGNGIEVRGSGHVLETNYVGMSPDGTTAAGNGASGILLVDATNTRIGGTTIARRNLVSGNTGKGNGGGIMISGGGSNTVQGNFIGIDATGTLDRGNEGRGIAISGSANNLIGGAAAGAGNLISGNRATGVRMLGGSNDNVVQGNYIGVNRTVTDFIKNDRGVQIRGGNNNKVIGNLIAGQVYDGVLIWQGATNSLVYRNFIAYNGLGPIGDPTEAAFNGVAILDGTGNYVLSNSIFNNTDNGIRLVDNSQVFPTLTSAIVSGSTTTVTGSLAGTSGTAFLIQLFASPACDSTGEGQGQYFIGETTVTANASGVAPFNVTVGTAYPANWVVTATATRSDGNTSQFSACAYVH